MIVEAGRRGERMKRPEFPLVRSNPNLSLPWILHTDAGWDLRHRSSCLLPVSGFDRSFSIPVLFRLSALFIRFLESKRHHLWLVIVFHTMMTLSVFWWVFDLEAKWIERRDLTWTWLQWDIQFWCRSASASASASVSGQLLIWHDSRRIFWSGSSGVF